MLTLQLSPLELEGYYVREFYFAVRPDLEEQARLAMQTGLHIQTEGLFNPDPISINMLAGGGRNQEDPSRWVAIVELKTQGEPKLNFPYDFRAVLVGYFSLTLPQPAELTEDAERAIKINTTSMLYSAAREFIANVTGRGPFPAAVIPSVVIRFGPESKEVQAGGKSAGKKSAKKSTGKKGKKKST